MTRKSAWTAFPYPADAYHYPAAQLKKHWARLHRGDCEPYPADESAQAAWRAYHAGNFADAVKLGLAAGDSGLNAANKAQMIYANYLADEESKLQLLEEVAQRCETQQQRHPKDPNAWYYHAYALGRYSQGISVAKALAMGLGGKIKTSLDTALKLQPKHADAHIALGTWHAEIIDKVGSMVGGLTYGAKKDAALEHFQTALKLNPDTAIGRTEYADGLVMLFGKSKLKDAETLYQEAAEHEAADAMERLDAEAAKAQFDE